MLKIAISPTIRRYRGSASVDPDAEAFFAAASAAGTPVSDSYKTKYRNYIAYLKAAGKWTSSDSRYVWATGNEVWAKIDLRNPSRSATIQNTYAGRFTADQGWNGNTSLGILTNFNPGDGGTYNYTQNNCSVGCLMLDNDSASGKQEISSANSGFTGGLIVQAYNPAPNVILHSLLTPATSFKKYRFNSYCWLGINRTASTTSKVYQNGVLTETQTATSTAIENKAIAIMGAYNGAWSAGFYTSNSHAVFYAGSGALDQVTEMNAFNYAFNYANKTNVNKLVYFQGDSRTVGVTNSSLSVNATYPKAVITGLGTGWSGVAFSENGRTVQTMNSIYTTEIRPYVNSSLTKKIYVAWGGLNDIFNSGRTGAQVYADIVSQCQQAKADGLKVVIVGEMDANYPSYATMNGHRAALRTLMLADFTGSTGVTNVFSAGAGVNYADLYVDIYADTRFQTYSNTTYYQADGNHLNATGSGIIGTTYVLPAIQLL